MFFTKELQSLDNSKISLKRNHDSKINFQYPHFEFYFDIIKYVFRTICPLLLWSLKSHGPNRSLDTNLSTNNFKNEYRSVEKQKYLYTLYSSFYEDPTIPLAKVYRIMLNFRFVNARKQCAAKFKAEVASWTCNRIQLMTS